MISLAETLFRPDSQEHTSQSDATIFTLGLVTQEPPSQSDGADMLKSDECT